MILCISKESLARQTVFAAKKLKEQNIETTIAGLKLFKVIFLFIVLIV